MVLSESPVEQVDAGENLTALFPPRFNVGPCESPLHVLFVYSRPPIPMRRADQMTVAHLLQFLKQRGHITDLLYLDDTEEVTPACRRWLLETVRHYEIIKLSKFRRKVRAALGAVRCLPLQVGLFYSHALEQAVRQRLQDARYDMGYCYYIRTAYALQRSALRGLPAPRATFLAMQLAQSLNTQRIASATASLKDKVLYGIESRLLRGYEARIPDEYDRVGLISQHDVRFINESRMAMGLPALGNIVLTPHGVDVSRFRPGAEATQPTLVFSGSMSTNTNVDAIKWFTSKCWPTLKAQIPALRLLVVGRNPGAEVRALGSLDGVTVTGEVPNPASYIGLATICINPMQAGAGMQNKLIEYLACGKAVVATSLANEGIGAAPDEHLLIANDPHSFVEAITGLVADSRRRSNLGERGREYVENCWTWEYHFLKQEQQWLQTLGARPKNHQ